MPNSLLGEAKSPQSRRDPRDKARISRYTQSMTQDINLGGTIYISSKRAAEITGYSQDYIGQLARGGQIDARRVAGLWYILEESLMQHKHKADEFVPTPPTRVAVAENDASVNFDGKDYISASRAAKITGYSQDYVGQLARGEKISSRQIGSRWYVDRAEIIEHKRHNDSLLGAVQAASVGIMHVDSSESPEIDPGAVLTDLPHFSYIQEEISPMPIFETNSASDDTKAYVEREFTEMSRDIDADAQAEERQIPIRVLETDMDVVAATAEFSATTMSIKQMPGTRIAIYSVAFLAVVLVIGVAYWKLPTTIALTPNSAVATVNNSAVDALSPIVSATARTGAAISVIADNMLSKEIRYQRQNR